MEDALSVAEIIQGVLDFCGPQTLARCARVSSTWSKPALARLWKGSCSRDQWVTPFLCPSAGLQTFCKPKRLRSYLRNVRYYKVWGHDHRTQFLQRLFDKGYLTAPKAVHLDYSLDAPICDDLAIAALLVPSLRSVEVTGVLTSYSLRLFKEHCPQLRFLKFLDVSEDIDSDAIIWFLKSMPQIVKFDYLMSPIPGDTDVEAILVELLSRPNLMHLTLPGPEALTASVLERTLDKGNNHAAMSLRSLLILRTCRSSLDRPTIVVLEGYLFRFKNLRFLELAIRDLDPIYSKDPVEAEGPGINLYPRLFEMLSHFTQLQDLELETNGDSLIDMPDLIKLAEGCPFLRSLEIGFHRDLQTGDPLSVFDEERGWKDLAVCLPSIETLRIRALGGCIKMHHDSSEVVSFATNCPKLRRLCINAPFDPTDLREIPLLCNFTCLEVLSVCFLTQWRRSLPQAIRDMIALDTANLLLEHMPRLRLIENYASYLYNDDDDEEDEHSHRHGGEGSGIDDVEEEDSDDLWSEVDSDASDIEDSTTDTEDNLASDFCKEGENLSLLGRCVYLDEFCSAVNEAITRHRSGLQPVRSDSDETLVEKLLAL